LDGLNEATANYENTSAEYNDLLRLIKGEISELSMISIPNTQTALDQVRETLEAKKEELETTTSTLELMKNSLDSEEKTWLNRVQQNQLLLPEFESEYNAVCSAEAAI